MPASVSEDYVSPPLDPTTGLALKSFDWGGHRWSNDSGQTWNLNVPYAIGLGATKLRFELHDTTDDRGLGDSSTQRRAEMSMGNKLDRFFNDRDYWHAFTFIAHADCIACLTKGGTIMQMHWPSKGNPAFAFRLVKYGGGYGFRITTRGDQESNVKRYTGPLVGDVPHDIVYHFKLNGAAGALDVWLDGQQILSLSGVPIGSSTEDGYSFRIGAYYGSLGGTNVVQEYGNIAAFPASDDLSSRIASPPPW